MASTTAARPRGSEFDPMRWLWQMLTSVRFALALIGFLALATLAGTAIPQLPVEMRSNPAAVSAWLAFQEGRFGVFTDAMYRLRLFEIFRSVWFGSALGLLVVSVCVCTANRLPPIWRNTTQPQTRVPDEYFERQGLAIAAAAPDADALATELRRRRYRVTLTREGTSTYLFADRYPWAQLATFVSHLALILFLAGGVVTVLTAKEYQVFAAEGESGQPVFATNDPDHMQVYVEDAVGRFDETGFPLDFRTQLIVYQNGQEVARGVTTVNSPLSYGGFRFHQAAYFPDGAGLQVREIATGRLVYDQVLALTDGAFTPRIVVRDAAGSELLSDAIVPTDFFGDTAGTTIAVPGDNRTFWIGAQPGVEGAGWQLVVFETARGIAGGATLLEGQRQDFESLSISFVGMTTVPSTGISSLPGSDTKPVAELSKGPQGQLLTVGPIQGRALALSPNDPVRLGPYEYTFTGQREFSGLTVRRDPGSTLIWIATGTFLLGLALTFYTPRRRLWGKIAAGQALFRGLGGRAVAIEREVRQAAERSAITFTTLTTLDKA